MRAPPGGVWCFVVIAALAPPLARADEPREGEAEVVLLDGTRHVGRVVRESDAAIELEVRRGQVSARITIPRAEVRLRRDGGADPVDADRERRAAAARALPDPAERGAALLRLAEEAEAGERPAAAARLFLEAGQADPSVVEQTEVAAARTFMLAGQELEAERALRRALERNPKNAQAAAMARRLEQVFEARSAELVEPGVRAWAEDDPRRALRLLVRAVEALPPPALERASAKVEAETGLTLAQVMVDCRLRAPCAACDGAGALECPASRSNASTRCRFGRVFDVTDLQRTGGVRHATARFCQRCDGEGTTLCDDCAGSGLSLGRPTDHERAELVKVLTQELEGLERRAEELGGKAGDERAGDAVRSVLATELLGVLRGIRARAEAITRLDPRAGAVGGGDLRRRDRANSQRMASVMTMLANALYLAGEKRYEDAVLQGEEDGRTVPWALRAVRARQAWEVVNQARIYMQQALALDPGSAAAGAGDARRRLLLCERFLDRTWRTYVSLRVAEKRLENDDSLAARILEQAGGAVDQTLPPVLPPMAPGER